MLGGGCGCTNLLGGASASEALGGDFFFADIPFASKKQEAIGSLPCLVNDDMSTNPVQFEIKFNDRVTYKLYRSFIEAYSLEYSM
jgi:hypothetical protein